MLVEFEARTKQLLKKKEWVKDFYYSIFAEVFACEFENYGRNSCI